MGQVLVAAVEDGSEQVVQQPLDVFRQAGLSHPGSEGLGRDLDVANLASGGGGDLVYRLGEREESRSGELVDLALMTVFGERGDSDIGDVVGIDERFAYRPGFGLAFENLTAEDKDRIEEYVTTRSGQSDA